MYLYLFKYYAEQCVVSGSHNQAPILNIHQAVTLLPALIKF